MASLNEQDITQITLRFLKSHYRQRQREGAAMLSANRMGAGGIKADGFIRFPQVQGEDFQATVEATSADSRYEVRYKVKKSLLGWDSVASALFLTTAGFAVLYVREILPMDRYNMFTWISFLLGAAFLAFFFFYGMLRLRRRYRYIPALEQFKKYYANEQWVAIAEDVFPNYHDDSYYLELREQCIYNGFGLIVIRENKPPIIQVTPSRQDLFKHRRRLISFLPQAEFNKMARKERYEKATEFASSALRYKYQIIVCLISILAIAGILYQESQRHTLEEQEYADYQEEMEQVRQRNRGNILPDSIRPNLYVIDTPFIWPPPFRKDVKNYLELGLAPEPPPGPAPLLEPREEEAGFILPYPDVAGLITYDCSQLRIEGDAFVVQERVYSSYSLAAPRIAELSSYGLEVYGMWLGCFLEAGSGYVVYFGPVFREEAEAERAMKSYATQMGDNVLNINLEVRALSIKPQ
ncbi:MAG: hypothetical protein J5I94_26870 [Phaeodactylibacter sp.]|nr:hypothetical protein [Phaeodactylibacter sp.]